MTGRGILGLEGKGGKGIPEGEAVGNRAEAGAAPWRWVQACKVVSAAAVSDGGGTRCSMVEFRVVRGRGSMGGLWVGTGRRL